MMKKAFTLAEIFLATVILSVLVSVCLTFFNTGKDYEREYFYYSAYQNLVKVVDAALLNEQYLRGPSKRVEETTCGTTSNGYKCRAFKAETGNLCNVFKDYFNTTGTVNCAVSNDNPVNGNNVSMKLTNGMEIYFDSQASKTILPDSQGYALPADENGYNIWVDINGHGNGEDKKYYDIMPFYITLSGKVVPGVGQVTGLRGYEFDGLDAGGNASLMAFDIVTVPPDSNYLKVEANSLSFREAACRSGYLEEGTNYCKYSVDYVEFNDTPGEIRLVKKLKRTK